MALVRFGGGISQMSGSIGGTCFARNAAGSYARARTKPVNPQTSIQEKIRAVVAYLTDRWLETVTPTQRAAWSDYALAVSVKNRIGDPIHISGFNHYIRSNAALLYADATVVDEAPTEFSLPEHDPTASFTASEATQNLSVSYNDSADWCKEVGGYMFVRMSRPQNPTRNFFAGPYLYAGDIAGMVEPLQSPQDIVSPTPIVAGHRLWLSCRIARADGRLSESFQVGPTLAGA